MCVLGGACAYVLMHIKLHYKSGGFVGGYHFNDIKLRDMNEWFDWTQTHTHTLPIKSSTFAFSAYLLVLCAFRYVVRLPTGNWMEDIPALGQSEWESAEERGRER